MEETRRTLDEIWPIIQEANKIAPKFSKIPKPLVQIAPAEKPSKRAGKGTVQRQNMVKSFSREIDALFSSQETNLLTEGLSLATPISPTVLEVLYKRVVPTNVRS